MEEVIRSMHIPYTEEELKTEIWKKLNGINNLEVSNIGRVRRIIDKEISEVRIDKDGYLYSKIRPLPRHIHIKIHRMVAIAFVPNPDCKETVNHDDGNKQNNRAWNLSWNTRKENTNHAVDTGLWTNNFTVKCYDIKTNETKDYMSINRLAEDINLEQAIIIAKAKFSEEYPILGRYVININDVNGLKPINTSGKDAVSIYALDLIGKTIEYYESLIMASYHTGLSSSWLSNIVSGKKFDIITSGYMFNVDKELLKIPTDINVNKLIEYRNKNRSMDTYKRDFKYFLYDYKMKEEFIFDKIESLVSFINTKNTSNKIFTKKDIALILANIHRYKHTALIYGYGIKSSTLDYVWYDYKEAEIINSKNFKPLRSAVYEVEENGKKLFIFGNINLGIYLGVFKEAKNLRSNVDRFIDMYGIYKLIEISNRPYIKIRKLESKIFEK